MKFYDSEDMYEYERPIYNRFGDIIGMEHIETNFPLPNIPKMFHVPINQPMNKKCKPRKPKKITIDDVLDMHLFLKKFDGNFINLLIGTKTY